MIVKIYIFKVEIKGNISDLKTKIDGFKNQTVTQIITFDI